MKYQFVNELGPQPCRFRLNEKRVPLAAFLHGEAAHAFHSSMPEYHPTPLLQLSTLGKEFGLAGLAVKDEAHRFGLNAFKALGASWAVETIVRGGAPVNTFTTATDGNHGRAVAWSARRAGSRAIIYMPKGSVAARIAAIRGEGAEVIIFDGNYDAAVAHAAATAAANGWTLVQDSSWPGYEDIPRHIMEGYLTLFGEIDDRQAARPDIVFLQAGVGSFAAAGVSYIREHWGDKVRIVIVEPLDADCLYTSICSPTRSLTASLGRLESIMAGLCCGVPSSLAWPYLRDGADLFLAIDDEWSRAAIRRFTNPLKGDPAIISGESGAAGLAALLAMRHDPELREAAAAIGLDGARVLLINTEGATDPENYRRIINSA